MASTYLTRTQLNGSRTTNTVSVWVKRSSLGTVQHIFSATDTSPAGNPDDEVCFESNDALTFGFYGDGSSGVTNGRLVTNRLFRDTSAWYHIVAVWDTTNSTSSDRMRIYVNGVRETSFATATYPSQNTNSGGMNNSSTPLFIGQRGTSVQYYDGSMSHFHWTDGTAYDADTFGETDATTGIWKPKTAPSVTYGTNGFFLKFENSGAFGTDSSGNANTFTVNGTMTQTIDTPSNVFATLNPLWSFDSTRIGTFTNGNNTWTSGSNVTWYQSMGNLAFSSGKYYWEVKVTGSTNIDKSTIGICGVDAGVQTGQLQDKTPSVFFKNEDGGEMRVNAVTGTNDYGTFAQNDIMGIAVDMDSLTMSLYKNGTVLVNAHDISAIGSGAVMTPATMHYNQNTHQYNFGNGYFGTVKVSTANSDTAGIGEFEYEVPNGYYSLCTKNLNLQEYD